MAGKKDNDFISRLSFPKTPKKASDRQALFKKLKDWYKQESKLFPYQLDIYKTEKTSISFASPSKKIFIGIAFTKPINVYVAVNRSEEETKELNSIVNKFAGYLNTLLGEIAQQITVETQASSDFETKNLTKFFDKSHTEKFREKLGKRPAPIAAGWTFEFEGHSVIWLTINLAKNSSNVFMSDHTLKANIPLDFVRSEVNHMAKVEEFANQIIQMEEYS